MRKLTSKGQRRIDAIHSALKKKPMTLAQLAEHLSMGLANAKVYVDMMHKSEPKRLYISGHIANLGIYAGRPASVFSAGSIPDVEFVPLNRRATKISAAERRERILSLLKEKPMTAKELGARMHVVGATALKYIAQMKLERKVYIVRWMHPSRVNPESMGGAWAPVYAMGSKSDKPRPVGETSSQRHARRSQDPAYVVAQNRRRKIRYQVEKLRGKPQGIFAALGL